MRAPAATRYTGARGDAVCRDARPHEAVARPRVGEATGGVGGVDQRRVDRRGAQRIEHGVEGVELLIGVRVVGLVRHRQMGHHALELEARRVDDLLGERDGVDGPRADPVHSGVDLQVHRDGSTAPSPPRQCLDASRRVHDRPQLPP
jgi:hypothetical protein